MKVLFNKLKLNFGSAKVIDVIREYIYKEDADLIFFEQEFLEILRFLTRLGYFKFIEKLVTRYSHMINEPNRRIALLGILLECSMYDEFFELVNDRKFSKGLLKDSNFQYFVGVYYSEQGDFDKAKDYFKKSISIQKDNFPAMIALERVEDDSKRGALKYFLSLYESSPNRPKKRTKEIYYLMGRIAEKEQEYVTAFNFYKKYRDIDLAKMSKSLIQQTKAEAEIVKSCDVDCWRFNNESFNFTNPIFLTGLPRSGMTLLGYLMAQKFGIKYMGEYNFLQRLMFQTGYFAKKDLISSVKSGNFDKEILHGNANYLAEQMGFNHDLFIDKSFNNILLLGIARALNSRQKVIWLNRDELDNAWSIYSAYFPNGLEWACSLKAIKDTFAMQNELLEYYKLVYGEDLLVIDYTELVNQTDKTLDDIEDFLGINRAGYVNTNNTLPIKTSSLYQVSQAVYLTSLGRSRKYQKFVEQYLSI